ncbi:DUF7686 domain-containing protein [Paraburkholderia sacchari]|uniref:DUF7686 domain-containing protein n=1 Tax=Paraburkholderia sacchari TaxID=159450 RepID=UPI003D9695A4
MRLADADGVAHEFHFRSLLLGDQLSLEAFELAPDGGDRAKAGALCRDIVSAIIARERRIPSLEA